MGSGGGAGGSGSYFKLEDMAGQGHSLGCVLLAELSRRLFWLGLIRGGREGRISEISWVLCPGRSDLVYDGHGERNSDVSIGLYMVVVWWWCDGLLTEISRLVVMERWGRSGFLLVAR
ncbi:hypothetical protein M0R45_000297 [Rubus argutus]|uniref:Uncharacterized protein n=1 Tax=Rubus argutus TaxID=59490 RepID=A0AAW1VQC5_RUBAR